MKIVVTHLTRMKPGYFCVAGLHHRRGYPIRPVLPDHQRLPTKHLVINGGQFEIGALVDLGATKRVGTVPELEDREFLSTAATLDEELEAKAFWSLLEDSSEESLDKIFGADFESKGATSAGVDEGKGEASLGCLRPNEPPLLYMKDNPHNPHKPGQRSIRLRVKDGIYLLDLGVTDIRLYKEDHVTPDEALVKRIAARIKGGEELLLSVGLTRAMKATSPEYPRTHWLQLNNLHLATSPLWKLTD